MTGVPCREQRGSGTNPQPPTKGRSTRGHRPGVRGPGLCPAPLSAGALPGSPGCCSSGAGTTCPGATMRMELSPRVRGNHELSCTKGSTDRCAHLCRQVPRTAGRPAAAAAPAGSPAESVRTMGRARREQPLGGLCHHRGRPAGRLHRGRHAHFPLVTNYQHLKNRGYERSESEGPGEAAGAPQGWPLAQLRPHFLCVWAPTLTVQMPFLPWPTSLTQLTHLP